MLGAVALLRTTVALRPGPGEALSLPLQGLALVLGAGGGLPHRTTSGTTLKRRSSLPRRTSSRSGDSFMMASCSSLESTRGRPLTLTMMSPSWIPPLTKGETQGHSSQGPGLSSDTVGFNGSRRTKTTSVRKSSTQHADSSTRGRAAVGGTGLHPRPSEATLAIHHCSSQDYMQNP